MRTYGKLHIKGERSYKPGERGLEREEFKKRRRKQVRDSRNRVKANNKTWEELKTESRNKWQKRH